MDKKGVTIIELIVVLVIIAIAGALMTPGIGKWLPRYRLRSATRDIVSTMRAAQMRAIAGNVQYRVNFDSGEIGAANSYVLQRSSGGLFSNDGALQTIPSGIMMNTDLLPADKKVVFNPNSTCSTGSITLSYQTRGVTQAQRGIALNAATGRVTIKE